MSALGDPADRQLDAAADGAFGGKHANRRAGYTDPLAWALKQARKGGTLAAGEGLMLVKHYEALVEAAYREGYDNGYVTDPWKDQSWEGSDARKALEAQ